ncbi:MAG: type II secretion system protein [Armatimonadetes bacterium]|nr:type II secretion system protein [Armatimonadota bacterium]
MLKRRNGFTVIELLTVIAIIGVLAAFLFPVIASSRNNAKKTSCTSNMHQVWTALKMFQQNEGRYPDFIAGPSPAAGVDIKDIPGVDGGRAVSLYPEYIKSEQILYCPMAVKNGMMTEYTRMMTIADPLKGRVPGLRGTANPAYQVYPFSTYDVQNMRNSRQWEAHYSTAWLDPPGNQTAAQFAKVFPDFMRQLRWKSPPEDTVVTWCGYHREYKNAEVRSGSMDLVLFLDGHVQPMPSAKLYDNDLRTLNWSVVWVNAKP